MIRIKNILLILFVSMSAMPMSAFAQQQDSIMTVSGTVYEGETGLPLEIASINNGQFSSAFSDSLGHFTIKIQSGNDILSIKRNGFRTQEVALSNREMVEVYLYPEGFASFSEKAMMNDVNMPLAYASQSLAAKNNNSKFYKSDVFGAQTGEVVLKGNFAGLEVISRDGNVASGSDLFLRGYSSLNATNTPLIIVDGMIYDVQEYGSPIISGNRYNAFTSIDPSDIENITILKDGTSTFGAKGANGVIFINTGHATEQVNKISFNMSGGLNFAPRNLPLLESDEYRLYLNEMLISKGVSQDSIGKLPYFSNNPDAAEYKKYQNNTDWQKEIFANSFSSNYGLQIKGGDDIALYALSVNYQKYNGTIKSTDFQRFGMRFNSDIIISKVFSLNSNVSFSYNDKNLRSGTGYAANDNPLYNAFIKAPIFHPNVIDGEFVTPILADYDEFGVSNPGYMLEETDQYTMNSRVFGSFNFNAKINEHLTLSNLVGLSYNQVRERVFIPGYGIVPDTTEMGVVRNKMMERVVKNTSLNNDFRARYNNAWNNHGLGVIAGVRLNINSAEEDYAIEANSANDQLRTIGQGSARFRINGGYLGDWNSVTYYASANYNYLKKYFLSVNAALDGNSKFGKDAEGISLHGHKFGVFPSVSGAWLISSESFMKIASFIDVLKLRASYGLTGNDDIGFNATEKYYITQKMLAANGLIRGNLANSALKWETVSKMNAGIDLATFHQRLYVSVDVYNNSTKDMIEYQPVDYYTGFDYMLTNNGSFDTKGLDLTVNGRIISGKVNWDLGFVASKFTTEVTEIAGGQNITEFYGANILTKVGEPLAVFYGYKTNGVYASQQQANESGLVALLPNTSTVPFQAGDVIFEDTHEDGVIDEQDMQIIGNPAPDFSGQITTRLNWKAITLDASFGFSVGNDVYNYTRYKLESMQDLSNQTQSILNRWRYDGQVTDMPRAVYGDEIGNSRFSDRWIEDGSYGRLRNVTLTYDIPLNVSFIQNLEVFLSGINLFTITKYKGMDPEFSATNNPLTRGIDLGMPPAVKSVFAGVRVQL